MPEQPLPVFNRYQTINTFNASTMASPILGWVKHGSCLARQFRPAVHQFKISMGMKNADSPIASQMAHFARNASPCLHQQKQSVKKVPDATRAYWPA
jgi:hypothetical protein